MRESTYNPCLLFRFRPLGIIRIQIVDILILADDSFASTKKEAIKSTKIMAKDRK